MPSTVRERRHYDFEQALNGHQTPIRAVTLLPDKRVVTGSADGSLIVWRAWTKQDYDLAKAEVAQQYERSLPPGTDPFGWTHWDAKDTLLRQRQVMADLAGHEKAITCISTTSDGRLVSASEDGTLRIWREQREGGFWESEALCGHAGAIARIHLLDDHHIVSGGADGSLRLWTEQSAGTWRGETLLRHTSTVQAIDCFPNQDILSRSSDGALRIWHRSSNDGTESLIGHGELGSGVVRALSNDRVISTGPRSVSVWQLNPETNAWSSSNLEGVTNAQILPNGHIVGFTHDQSVAVYRICEQGLWERIASRSDWRDLDQLAVTPCGRIALRTYWMDEGWNRRDLDILCVTEDGSLASEARLSRKNATSELGDHPLSDGRFGIIHKDGSMELYNWKPA